MLSSKSKRRAKYEEIPTRKASVHAYRCNDCSNFGNVADEGSPFYLESADAEDLNAELSSKLIPNTDRQTWSYFVVPTRYKAGATYKVEFFPTTTASLLKQLLL